MEKLFVNTNSDSYAICICDSFEYLKDELIANKLNKRKVCIITDTNVAALYLEEVKKELQEISLEVYDYAFKAGEESKNLDTVQDLYRFLVDAHIDRKSLIVALGGGVVGDLAGFVAATYMRGIPFVQIPTTLLSQVDSSVGGKVGVDFYGNKNMVGAFYQPRLVYTNVTTLKTLDEVQFRSGMGEVLKHGLIMNEDYFDFIVSNIDQIKSQDQKTLETLIIGSCKIKSVVVSQDEKEEGIREILNFGHTFGHAIESLSNFAIPHGDCVVLGIVCALKYSIDQQYISKEVATQVLDVFNAFGYDLTIPFDVDLILKQMYLDKKTKDNIIRIVVLHKMGEAMTVKVLEEEIVKGCIQFAKNNKR